MPTVMPTKKDIAFTIYNHLGEVECSFSVYVEMEQVMKVLNRELVHSHYSTPDLYKGIIRKLYIPLLPIYEVDENWCINALLKILSPSDEAVELSIFYKNPSTEEMSKDPSEKWLSCDLQDKLEKSFYKETERSERISISIIADKMSGNDASSSHIKYLQEFCNIYSIRSIARAAYWMRLGRMTSQEIKDLWLKRCDSNYENTIIPAKTETFVKMLKEQFNNAFFWYVLTHNKDVIGNFNSTTPLKKELLESVLDTFLHSYITKPPSIVFQHLADTFGNIVLQSTISPDAANSLMFLTKPKLELLWNTLYSILQNVLKYTEGGEVKICLIESLDFIKIKSSNCFDEKNRILHRDKGVELVVIEKLLKTIHKSASLTATKKGNKFEIDLELPKCILM